jgi:hypothetical protein
MEGVLQEIKTSQPKATRVWFSDGYIFVHLADQRIVGHPVSWYPRLSKANEEQLQAYELWKEGSWIHWESLDEDLSAEGFLNFVKP